MLKETLLIEGVKFILDRINDDENVRNTVRQVGARVREEIPGDKIEPELNEFIEVFQEGMMGKTSE